MEPDWFSNDDLFIEQLRKGHLETQRVARALEAEGLKVEITPFQVRKDIEDRHDFADEHDLLVGEAQPCRIDVKSRDLTFSGPDDYPYETALVDTVYGWTRKIHKPLALVLVSQGTGGMAVVRPSGENAWASRRRYDKVRGIYDTFLEVDRDALATFDELVEWLRARESAPAP
jgi:hypothetical protein